MSQFSYQPTAETQESNGLAIAGFVCSLIGLIGTGGLLSPIGLILSLVALGKPSGKGFAIAGVVLGLIGSCGLVLILLLIPAAALALLGIGVALALAEPEKVELTTDMAHIAIAAKLYEDDQGVLPADLSMLDLRDAVLRDPWGNPYEYHFIEDDPGFDIVSFGEDGESGTDDDVYLTKLDETWEAAGNVDFHASADDDEGTVTFTIGNNVFTLHGDEDSGRITINTGEKVITLEGDEDGGHFTVDENEGHDEDDHDEDDHGEDDHGEDDHGEEDHDEEGDS